MPANHQWYGSIITADTLIEQRYNNDYILNRQKYTKQSLILKISLTILCSPISIFFFCSVRRLSFNPFPHIIAFGRLCSRRLFENIVTKEEIAQNMQFLLLTQCFPHWMDNLCFDKIRSKSSAAELSYEGKGYASLNPSQMCKGSNLSIFLERLINVCDSITLLTM